MPVRVAQVDRLEVGALHDLGAGDPAPAQVVAPGRPARPPTPRRARSGGSTRDRPTPSSSSGYSRQVTSVPDRPCSSPNSRWRAPRSSSLTVSLDQPHAEQVAVEAGRPLHVLAEQRHVVQAAEARPVLAHRKPSPPERRLNSSRMRVEGAPEDRRAGQQQDPDLHRPERERDRGVDRERRDPGEQRGVGAEAGEVLAQRQLGAAERRQHESGGHALLAACRCRSGSPRPCTTMPIRITSSDSGKLPHGAGGRSERGRRGAPPACAGRRRARRACVRPPPRLRVLRPMSGG